MRQNGRKYHRKQLEAVQRSRAYVLQFIALGRVFCENPGLTSVKCPIDAVGKLHCIAYCLAKFARLVAFARKKGRSARAFDQRFRVSDAFQFSAEVLRDKSCSSTRNIDVLADEIAVDSRDEVIGI